MLLIKQVKVIYRGEERDLYPADLPMRGLPNDVEALKALVEEQLELPTGALKDHVVSEVEGRWVIAPAPIFG